MITAHLLEWLQLIARWLHVVAAIAWVGASFYFIWVENVLSRKGKQRADNIDGHLWAIHGGGFYYLEKYKTAPESLPIKLHWFKWEAYVTWLSGFALLVIIYYLNVESRLISPESALSAAQAITLSMALIIGSWFVYDILCRSALLKKRPLLMLLLALIILTALIETLSPTLITARAVFLHIGAMLGTVMAGNVFFIIIPMQKRLVAAAQSNRAPDFELGKRAALRSLHNNYLTLPTVFLMISAHFPAIYQHSQNSALFVLLMIAGVLARHFFNVKNKGAVQWKWLIAAAITLIIAMGVSRPNLPAASERATTLNDIRPLIIEHCSGCHSRHPTDAVFRVAPSGFILDTDEQIIAAAQSIWQRVIIDRTMPFNNQTGMTDDDRQHIADWIQSISPPAK